MIRSLLLISGFFFTILFFNSCSLFRKTEKPILIKNNRKLEDKTADELLTAIYDSSFSAQWFSGKASVETDVEGKTNSFDISLRVKKDSVIWISISPLLGIEIARVLLTRDSVKFMDRYHKKFQVTDYNFLNELLRMNVDFDIVQGILTGNLFAYKKSKFNSVFIEENQYYILSTLSKHKLKRSLEEKDPNKPVIQDIWISDANYRIIRLSIEDDRVKKSLVSDYSDFRHTDSGIFPFQSKTIVKAEKDVNISIEYSKVAVNEQQEFPFTIPNSYERIH
jgi:hypothetical protein